MIKPLSSFASGAEKNLKEYNSGCYIRIWSNKEGTYAEKWITQ